MSFKFNYITNYQLEKFNEIVKTVKILENFLLNSKNNFDSNFTFFNTEFSNSVTKYLYKKHVDLNYLKSLFDYIYKNKNLFKKSENKNNIFQMKELFVVLTILRNVLESENEVELDIKFYIAKNLQNIFSNNYPITKFDILEYLEFNNIVLLKASLFKYLDQVSLEYLENFINYLTEIQEVADSYPTNYNLTLNSRLIDDLKEYIFSIIDNFEQAVKVINSFTNLTGKFFLSDYINNNCNNFVITFPLEPIERNDTRLNSLNSLLDILYTKFAQVTLKKEYLEELEYLIENVTTNYTIEKIGNNRKINDNLLNESIDEFSKCKVKNSIKELKLNGRKIFI